MKEKITIKCNYSELVQIHKLVANPRNPNKHPEEQIEILKRNLDFQGWRHPIIVSRRSGFIVAGHARLEAAIRLGLTEVPVSYQDFEDEAQEYAFMVADNKTAALAKHDDFKMAADIQELGLVDLDPNLLGLDSLNIGALENFDADSSEEFERFQDRFSDGELVTIKMLFERSVWEEKKPKIETLIQELGLADMSELFLKLLEK